MAFGRPAFYATERDRVAQNLRKVTQPVVTSHFDPFGAFREQQIQDVPQTLGVLNGSGVWLLTGTNTVLGFRRQERLLPVKAVR